MNKQREIKKHNYQVCFINNISKSPYSVLQGKLEYIAKTNNRDNNKIKQRKHKIIWFIPPFHSNIKTKVGRIFLKLLHKRFGHSPTKITLWLAIAAQKT